MMYHMTCIIICMYKSNYVLAQDEKVRCSGCIICERGSGASAPAPAPGILNQVQELG